MIIIEVLLCIAALGVSVALRPWRMLRGPLGAPYEDYLRTVNRFLPGAPKAGSRIADIYGATRIDTNSSHHQGIADPGSLTATGWTDDGLIEALEAPEARFALGVQWHPEHPGRRNSEMPLFGALIAAASA